MEFFPALKFSALTEMEHQRLRRLRGKEAGQRFDEISLAA
jgi:hypothetical protein